MLPDTQTMPGIARILNKIGARFHHELAPLTRLEMNELLENVSKRLSLKDYGDLYFLNGLQRLLESLQDDADLTFLGRILQRAAIDRSLENRLKFVDYQKKRPDIFREKLIPPIIIFGLPRSGTTFLHRLLAQDVNNRGLYFWELIRPIPPLNQVDRRRLLAKIEYKSFRQLIKTFDHIHVIRDTEFEECIFLQTLTFQSGAFWMIAPVYSYLEWCMKTDRSKSYHEYVQLLKIFQAQTPARRLTLKAPAHTGALNEIKRWIPGAILVQTHRHPVDVCNSVNSLVYYAQCNMVNRLDVRKMANCDLDMLANEIQRNLAVRKENSVDVIDVFYEEILSDPLGAVKRIYAHQGMVLTPETEERMVKFICQNPQHKHGKHKYRAEDFGMTDSQIIEKFEEYMRLFGYPS